MPIAGTCQTNGCDTRVLAKGMCAKHYQRAMRGGPRGLRVWPKMRRCAWCADDISAKRADARFCSKQCSDYWHLDTNRPAHYKAVREWAARNPDVCAAKRARRRGRTKACACLTPETFGAIRAASGGMCVYCGAAGEHFDHFIPASRGGLHCGSNLVFACARCNLAKSAKLPQDWSPANGVAPALTCARRHPERDVA